VGAKSPQKQVVTTEKKERSNKIKERKKVDMAVLLSQVSPGFLCGFSCGEKKGKGENGPREGFILKDWEPGGGPGWVLWAYQWVKRGGGLNFLCYGI